MDEYNKRVSIALPQCAQYSLIKKDGVSVAKILKSLQYLAVLAYNEYHKRAGKREDFPEKNPKL